MITPSRLAFYSSILSGIILIISLIVVMAVGTFLNYNLVPESNSYFIIVMISVFIGFTGTCFILAKFLKKNGSKYQIHLATQEGTPYAFTSGAMTGFMFGVFWRSIVVNLLVDAIIAFLKSAYGSDAHSKLLLLDTVSIFVVLYLSFWWLYRAPMGKYRIHFGKTYIASEIIIDQDSQTNKPKKYQSLNDSMASLKESIVGFLSVICTISYLGIGLVQMASTYSFFHDYWKWWVIPSAFFSSIIAYVPILGTLAGITAATKIWGWSLLAAICLFCFPLLIMLLITLLAGVTVTAAALFGKKRPRLVN